MELIYDTDINVKGEAIRLVFKISELFSAECVRNRLVNLFLELMATHNDELTKRVSLLIGEILVKLESYIAKSPVFLSAANKSFKEYGQHKFDEIRKNLASNIIPIIKILEPKNFIENFKTPYINLLLNDKYKEIRIICLGNLPEILKLIGLENSHKHFLTVLIKLMKDEDKEILKKLLSLFECILQAFTIKESNINFEDMNIVKLLISIYISRK